MDPKKMDEMVQEMEYLIAKEELWPLFCEYYVVVARAYMNNGDLKNARKYAQIADDLWVKYGGENHENVEEMQELWRDLDWMSKLANKRRGSGR